MKSPLVSIIIPTFNRVHLIEETLDSILAQTYQNWECIVVDDGSTDGTDALLKPYCIKDTRFQYHHRPNDKPKGANACRNYGLELSKGEYINWFDSDDLMIKNAIEIKTKKLKNSNFDFVITQTENFDNNDVISKIEYPDNKEISLYGFISQKNFWLTPDVMINKKIFKDVLFSVELKSGQEYNYFSKILINSSNGIFINTILTKRRIHQDSIQEKQKIDKRVYRCNKYKVYIITLIEIFNKADIESKNHLLKMAMSKAFEMTYNKEKVPNFKDLIFFVNKQKGLFKLILFLTSLFVAILFKKGYKLMNYSRN